ncbi:MAG: hypothetical protein C4527_02365 [Candidatus Omnitrophota bacterium]|jgi:hypothetical protein|nr:MAG: hypothetical protein C4527_02365 [Candidatus Omnitrophota bacterium]
MVYSSRLIVAALLLTIVVFQTGSANTQSPPAIPDGYGSTLGRDEIFHLANEYYRNGNLDKALNGYLYLVELGVSNGYLFYNLANTYFRNGFLGEAIVWYERASRYCPRDRDLQLNFEYAKSNLLDEEFRAPAYGGTVGFLQRLHRLLNVRESVIGLLILTWLFFAVLIALLLIRSDRWKSWLRLPCWLLGIAFVLCLFSTGWKIYHYEFVVEAIVVESAVEVKTGPNDSLSTSFSIHEGTKVRVVQEQGDWRRIVLPGESSFNGWVLEKAIRII